MDTNTQLAAYMDRAIERGGCKITLNDPKEARRLQQQLINRRTADRRQREKLDNIKASRWDGLSFFLAGSCVVIKANAFENAKVEDL